MSLSVVLGSGGGRRTRQGGLFGFFGRMERPRKQKVSKTSIFLSLLAFLLYPGIICGCVAGKNRNGRESEIKVSLHSISENLLKMEVEMLVQYKELESCSVSLKIFTAFSRLFTYRKDPLSYWKLQRKRLKMTPCRQKPACVPLL